MKIYNDLKYSDDYEICFGSNNTLIDTLKFHENTRQISPNAFSLCKHISKIEFNKNLTVIGESVFGLLNMKSLDLSDTNLEIIGKCAFFGAELEEIILPNTLVEIKNSAFANTKIEKMNFPESLQKLGKHVLLHNMEIKTIDLSKTSITCLENDVFTNVFNVDKILLPKNLKELECESLAKSNIKNLYVPSSLESFGPFASKTTIENIYYEGSNKKFISYLELSKHAKIIKNFYINNLEALIENGKSFKEINKTFKERNER